MSNIIHLPVSAASVPSKPIDEAIGASVSDGFRRPAPNSAIVVQFPGGMALRPISLEQAIERQEQIKREKREREDAFRASLPAHFDDCERERAVFMHRAEIIFAAFNGCGFGREQIALLKAVLFTAEMDAHQAAALFRCQVKIKEGKRHD